MKRALVVIGLVGVLVVPYYPVGVWPVPATGSMEPAITGCDTLVYGPPADVEVGDVVIFDAPWQHGAVLHRVVEERPGGYVLQGDANEYPDPMVVPPDHVLAEVRYVGKSGPYLQGVCDGAMAAADGVYDYWVGLLD